MLHLGPFRPRRTDATSDHPTSDWPERFRLLAQRSRDPRLRAYYAHGTVAGDTPIAATPLAAIDFETTGLDPARDGIVSIGVVPMSLGVIRASATRHWILKPREPLAQASVTLHGITDARVADAPDLDDILGQVLSMISGHVLVAHCAAIERRFLAAALMARINESIEFPVIDTMALEARLYRKQHTSFLTRLFGRRQTSIRLAASRSRYHLPRYRLHHASTDALATAELLQAQIAHRYSPDTPVAELWSD